MAILRTLQRALQAGQRDKAREIAAQLPATSWSRHDALGAARLAAESGACEVALSLLTQALEAYPDDADLREELIELLEDMGAEERAEALRHAGGAAPPPAADELPRSLPDDPEPGEHPWEPEGLDPPEDASALLAARDGDIVRMLQRFQGRENAHARQWRTADGKTGYSPMRQALTPSLLRAHLHGSITLGIYPIRLDHTVTFLALDLDITRRALDAAYGHRDRTHTLRAHVHEEGLALSERLGALGVPHLLFDSGYKGRHAWIFLATPQPAELGYKVISALARHLRPTSPHLALEAFPRQAGVRGDGLGNLIKLPLGIHLRTGRRAMLLDRTGQPVADPWPALAAVPRMPREALLDLLDHLQQQPCPIVSEAPEEATPEPRPSAPEMNEPPPFREADFERVPQLAGILAGCAVLNALKEKALNERRLHHNERLVLRHTLGHVERGDAAVRHLFGRCPEIPHDAAPNTRLRGSPMSCARVRQRIPETTARLPCHCAFPEDPDHYPSPVLHARRIPAAPAPHTPALADRLTQWLTAQDRGERYLRELEDERRELVEALRALPEHALDVPGGTWRLRDGDGLCTLVWVPEIGPQEAE